LAVQQLISGDFFTDTVNKSLHVLVTSLLVGVVELLLVIGYRSKR
jgi:hypothetical protein